MKRNNEFQLNSSASLTFVYNSKLYKLSINIDDGLLVLYKGEGNKFEVENIYNIKEESKKNEVVATD